MVHWAIQPPPYIEDIKFASIGVNLTFLWYVILPMVPSRLCYAYLVVEVLCTMFWLLFFV